jgi:phosphatidylserine decarboxylase
MKELRVQLWAAMAPWHSPVSGTIRKAYIKQGSYYSATEAIDMDPASPNDSQGYISHVATRAIIYIEADDPKIGLMIMMPIGMAEVSSCVLGDRIKEGYRVKKGRNWVTSSTADQPTFLFSGPVRSKSFWLRKMTI